MFLQVIWNPNLKQTSLLVGATDSNEDFPVIVSFILKEDISTSFVQNLIGYEKLQLLYIEDDYLWLENFHLTKNILSFLNLIDIIDLTVEDLNCLNQFILKNKLSINDFDNLGYQSPVKTIPRDLSTKPQFMSAFLNIADYSKRLLRTTFDFIDGNLSITINKRAISPQHFINHLNSDRDRLRIKESLAFAFDKKPEFIDFISSLEIFSDDVFIPNEQTSITEEEEISQPVIDLHISTNTLSKVNTIEIPFNLFLNSVSIVDSELDILKSEKIKNVLEDFSDKNTDEVFSSDFIQDEFPKVPEIVFNEEYDNSVYIEQSEQSNNILVEEDIDELTEDFLVEIETNLIKHEQSLQEAQTNVETNENEVDENLENAEAKTSVSVDELVDSINDIIEEPTPTLELIDIIELPLIYFLSDVQPATNEEFLDNYFSENNVQDEINQFSAEDVLIVVNTEVSIFENTVQDKKKKSKNKKNKLLATLNVENTSHLLENNDKNTSILEVQSSLKETTDNSLIIEQSNPFVKEPILEKQDSVEIIIQHFIIHAEIIQPLLVHSVEKIEIIEFLLSADLIDDSIVPEENINFNFFEESKKKLIDLAMAGDIEGIEELYKNYPEFEKPLINFNYEGDNPLCIASFYENIDLLKKLIDYGWNPNYFDSNLNNALIIACAEGHKHIVKYLLTQDLQINFQNKIGYTALHFAVNDCNHRIVKLLLEAGADVEISDNERNTPLSLAAFKGDINSTKLLLQKRVNVHTKNKKGYDARSIALITKNHAVAKLIEDKIISEKHNHSLPPIIEKNI